jgi:hypothetical protein
LQEALGTADMATKRDIECVEGQLREMKAEINGKLTLDRDDLTSYPVASGQWGRMLRYPHELSFLQFFKIAD